MVDEYTEKFHELVRLCALKEDSYEEFIIRKACKMCSMVLEFRLETRLSHGRVQVEVGRVGSWALKNYKKKS